MHSSLLKAVLLAAERQGLRAGWASQLSRVITRAADVTAPRAAQEISTHAAQLSGRARGNCAPSKQADALAASFGSHRHSTNSRLAYHAAARLAPAEREHEEQKDPVDPTSHEAGGRRVQTRSGQGDVVYLDRGDSEEDMQGALDWSDAEEEDVERQTRHSPHGPKPRLRRLAPKKRKGIGRQAVIPPLPAFDSMIPRLQAYKDRFGDCLVPKRYWDDYELGDWSHRIRCMLKDKVLPVRQFELLDQMGFPWTVPLEVASWEVMYHEMRRYKEEYGNLDVPFKWKDPMADFNNHFARWFHAQPTLFLQRRLRPDQVRKLMVAGYDMQKVTGDEIGKADYIEAQKEIATSGESAEFDIMFAEMEAWKATYYTTVIPRMVYDNPVLGMWAWSIRRACRQKKLAQWKIDRLDEIEFLWKVDPQTAKWHHNLHEARRYKEVHGTGNIPLDYKNPAEPAWQEASQWLQRQARLFRKQALPDKRYRIMREVLGIKFVRQYAPRVVENRKRMGIQTGPSKKLPSYGRPLGKNVLI